MSRAFHTSNRQVRAGTPTFCIGIDPGASGGIAVLSTVLGGLTHCRFVSLSSLSLSQLHNWLARYHSDHVHSHAVLEKVTGYVGDTGNPGSAMFNFGRNYGQLEMCLTVLGIPYDTVTPNIWQRAVGISPRKTHGPDAESKTEWKRRLKEKAESLYPNLFLTLATSDAVLIAHYCRSKFQYAQRKETSHATDS